MSAKTILLSGASGMMGSALQIALRNSGGDVRQLVRRTPVDATQVFWDPAASRPVRLDALEGADAAIHLSGANVAVHRWTAKYKREIASSRIDSTRALAVALAGLQRPPRVLLVASATGIYGDRNEELLDESSPPGDGFLSGICQMWEQASEPTTRAGIRVVHLRFGVVLSRGRGALGKMLPAFRLGLGGRLGSGRQWMSWIAIEDAVAAAEFLMNTPAIAGAVNLTSPHPVRNAEFAQTLARCLHRPALVAVPAWALRLALGEMAEEALLASARVEPAKLLIAGFRFKYPHLDQALTAAISPDDVA